MTTMRRVSFAGLCVVPFVVFTAAAARPLCVPALYQAVGVAACLPIVVASRVLRLQAIRSTSPLAQQLALAGGLLLVPFTVMALLWIGIGTPLDATPHETGLHGRLPGAQGEGRRCRDGTDPASESV